MFRKLGSSPSRSRSKLLSEPFFNFKLFVLHDSDFRGFRKKIYREKRDLRIDFKSR